MAKPSSNFNNDRNYNSIFDYETANDDEMWQHAMTDLPLYTHHPITPSFDDIDISDASLPSVDTTHYSIWSPYSLANDATSQPSQSEQLISHSQVQDDTRDTTVMTAANKDSIGTDYLYYYYGQYWETLSTNVCIQYRKALARQRRNITINEAKEHIQIAIDEVSRDKLMNGTPREQLYAANHIYHQATGNVR